MPCPLRTQLAKLLPTPLMVWVFAISMLVFTLVKLPLFVDPDIGWHIAAGDLIRSTGQLQPADPWAFTAGAQPWYNISWLWDLGLSYAQSILGMDGLFVLSRALPALLLALLVGSLQTRNETGASALFMVALITFFCLCEFVYLRPQLGGLFIALGFAHLLHHARHRPESKRLWLLPVLMVAWVNIHGSFLAGYAILGAYGLEAMVQKDWRRFRRLFAVGVVCLLALLVNPYGQDVVVAVARSLHSAITVYIDEWKPFTFGNVVSSTLWLMVLVMVGNMRNSKVPLADKILLVIALVGMLTSARNIGLLAILGAPYLLANLPADDMRDANTQRLNAWARKTSLHWLHALVVVASVGIGAALVQVLPAKFTMEDPKKSPLAAIDYVAQHHKGARVLNDYDIGGRIIHHAPGAFRLFVDGRAGTVYSEEVLEDYIAIAKQEKKWEALMEKHQFDVLLLLNGHRFIESYKEGEYRDSWKQTYSDDVATVFVRTGKITMRCTGKPSKK
jgi:hypothetical protein